MVQRFIRSQRWRWRRVTYILCPTDVSALIYWREEDVNRDDPDFGGSYAPSAHDRRKLVFLQNDPVHTTNLMVFMREHLALVQTELGVQNFREVCLRHVDEALVDQMHTILL